MGLNLYSCCHLCRKKVFHFRGRENETIIPFYRLHEKCLRQDKNTIETKDDQHQEEFWMGEKDGYVNQWEYDKNNHKYIFKEQK